MANTEYLDCSSNGQTSLERVRYFPRMLITPDEMISEQAYFREKMRRHNKILHGWGIVCGGEVRAFDGANQECKVCIEPGYILGPFGDEIIISKALVFDLRTELLGGCPATYGQNGETEKTWTSDVNITLRKDATYYIATKYMELETRPVRAMAAGCSCDETLCEPSRYLDSYMIKALKELPGNYDVEIPAPPDIDTLTHAPFDEETKRQLASQKCLPCPVDPWIVLAVVKVEAGNLISEKSIDNYAQRRNVISFGHFWWNVPEEDRYAAPTIASVMPNTFVRGEQDLTITISGSGFNKNSIVDFLSHDSPPVDAGITVNDDSIQVSPACDELSISINVSENAVPGVLKVKNPNGKSASIEYTLEQS